MKSAFDKILFPKKWAGLKIAAIGFSVAIIGAGMAFSFFPAIGYWITTIGIFLGIAGIGWGNYVNFFSRD